MDGSRLGVLNSTVEMVTTAAEENRKIYCIVFYINLFFKEKYLGESIFQE